MLRYASETTASPAEAWSLMARPGRWHEWAPQLRGAWGLSGPDGEVREGARGAARLLGVVPVPATVTEVVPGRSWAWRVGPLLLDHRVEPTDGGCRVVTELHGGALEPALALSYGPVVAVLMRRLGGVAAQRSGA